VKFPPANIQLRRAQLVLMLVVLVPTVLMAGIGVILIVIGGTTSIIYGVLVLTFCTSGITGFILVSIFVTKGAGLARLQNDFTSAVSHELRTPVTSIHLLLESLRDDRLNESDRKEVLTLLARETKRLETLVDRVLELSKLEAGQHVWLRESVDIRELVDEAVAMFDAHTLSNPTPVTIDVERGLVAIGDRATLVRAIGNLLHNAWKYTGTEKKIAIEARALGRRIFIIVRDNGIGIERADQPSIYEQFKRGRAIHESGIPGVGLGLAFVRTIVHGNRGKLTFESEPGNTAFRIRLKRQREPEDSRAGVAVAS
jgi:two-component system phosphate regulon sensor histidine kinase PhoR